MADERISLTEAARRSGVPQSTLKRWAEEKIVPVRKGRWTPAAAAQARVVARMRDRGYSLEDLKEAGKAFGMPTTVILDRNGCEIGTMAGPAEWASDDGVKLVSAAINP